MTAATRQDAVPLAAAAQQFEQYARDVSPIVGGRALYWASVSAQFQQAGYDPARMAPQLAAENERATRLGVKWQQWINALDDGRAELVPVQVGNGPVTIAVRPISRAELGWWPLVVTVVRYASQAALVAAGYFTVNAYQDTQQTLASARKTDADTRSSLAALAEMHPQIAPQVLSAMEEADKAAHAPGPDWIDRLTGAATGIAAGIGSGAMLLLAWWWFTQRGKRKRNPTRRRRGRR